MLGPWGAFWVLMKGQAKDRGPSGKSILTNIGAASVEQVLVHHRHAVLGERTGQFGEGKLPFLPEMGRSG